MKDFTELNQRLQNLTSGLDGELWRRMMSEAAPPRLMPPEQDILDLVFRDAKAVSGYVPDLMALMRRHVPGELDAANLQALRGILGFIQFIVRLLIMILLFPRYLDHEDLISTFNAYRQTLTFVEDYLAQADRR
ncbi:MAG: hypothetical protein LBC90_00910 [Candidatus Adiutrix sp.]|jgi:hypothetical protein|nr:hypothetical protein [Candidatus Adiutrix sp.]